MPKILLIDFSTIANRCWHMMKSPGYLANTNSESVEFSRNLGKAAEVIKARFNDYTLFVCADSAVSWRRGVWESEYWRDISKGSCSIEGKLYLPKDGNWFTTALAEDGSAYPFRKCDKEEIAAAKAHEKWEAGSWDKALEPAMRTFMGAYKGSRKDSIWNYTTEKKVQKQWIAAAAPRFAATLDGGFVKCETAEADDLVAWAVRNCPDCTVISTDQDIAFSKTKGLGQLMDMAKASSLIDSEIIGPMDTALVLKNAVRKVLGGDPGDDIGPCLTTDGKRCTPKEVEKLLEYGGDFMELIDETTWDRNYKLIWLRDAGPLDEDIQEAFEKAFDLEKYGKLSWNLTDDERLMAMSDGLRLRNMDNNPLLWKSVVTED